MINISKLDKAEVLAALYNGSGPLGLGIFQFNPAPMTTEEAAAILLARAGDLYFDYLKGRVMKVSLNGEELDPYLYDRDNGQGAAERALASLARK